MSRYEIAPGTTSHEVDQSLDLVIAYPTSGSCEIHKKGCNHASARRSKGGQVSDFTGTLGDDWVPVSPCARVKKGRK